jgi:ATP adenylyltransferase
MKFIWAPWRVEYLQSEKTGECILCQRPKDGKKKDKDNYILYRGNKNYIIMNKYPYTMGHLMIAPYSHVGSLEELSEEERHGHFDIVSRSVEVLKEVFKPVGFNIGINIGSVAGAGVEGHVHTHVVPRWPGDTNFMPVIADVKVVSEALSETYKRLKGKF